MAAPAPVELGLALEAPRTVAGVPAARGKRLTGMLRRVLPPEATVVLLPLVVGPPGVPPPKPPPARR